jgi:hypothetical protein
MKEVTSGELSVLKAIREGNVKRGKICRYLRAKEEYVEEFLSRAISKELIKEEKGKFYLTHQGLEAVLELELRKEVPRISTREIVVDKAVGSVLMILGCIFIYMGYTLAMEIFMTEPPELEIPEIGLGVGTGTGAKEIFSPITSLFSNYVMIGLKLAGAFLVIYIGGLVLHRGIQLFRR